MDDVVGRVTTVLGGHPTIITVDFTAGVEPAPGAWLITARTRYRVLDARKIDTAGNRWKMRADRIPGTSQFGSDALVLPVEHPSRDRRAEAARRIGARH